MAAAYSSRDLVEDFLRLKLLSAGLDWPVPARRPGAAVTSQQDPPPAPPRLQAVLRRAGDELERRYGGVLWAQVSAVLACGGGAAHRRRGLTAVRRELFRDGVNWGRIVAMMELGGALCTEAVRTGAAWQLDDIIGWLQESLDSPPLRGWMDASGGWDAFVSLYGAASPPAAAWSLRALLGLAVLGAAGLTLGLLFRQQ